MNGIVTEREKNEREMLTLFRKLNWKEQVILIGRMETMTERNESARTIVFSLKREHCPTNGGV